MIQQLPNSSNFSGEHFSPYAGEWNLASGLLWLLVTEMQFSLPTFFISESAHMVHCVTDCPLLNCGRHSVPLCPTSMVYPQAYIMLHCKDRITLRLLVVFRVVLEFGNAMRHACGVEYIARSVRDMLVLFPTLIGCTNLPGLKRHSPLKREMEQLENGSLIHAMQLSGKIKKDPPGSNDWRAATHNQCRGEPSISRLLQGICGHQPRILPSTNLSHLQTMSSMNIENPSKHWSS